MRGIGLSIVAALFIFVAGCPGGGKGAEEPDTKSTGNGIGDGRDKGGQTTPADPEAALRSLVEEVVGLAEGTDCSELGAKLTSWTNAHQGEIASLIGTLKGSSDEAKLAELDDYVETRRLAVLEAAVECADNEDAYVAWQHFEQVVDEARQ